MIYLFQNITKTNNLNNRETAIKNWGTTMNLRKDYRISKWPLNVMTAVFTLTGTITKINLSYSLDTPHILTRPVMPPIKTPSVRRIDQKSGKVLG
jgi:hypothetical protein